MHGLPLDSYRILVVEDEFLLADDLCFDLERAGAMVIGPFGHMASAMGCANAGTRIDAAVLDINVAGEEVYPLADLLTARAVPIIFATGHTRESLPERFAMTPICHKPVVLQELVAAVRAQKRTS